MTISYVIVTIVAVLMLELALFAFLAFYVLKGGGIVPKLRQTAQQYAQSVSGKVKKRYPTGTPIEQLLPDRIGVIEDALQGTSNSDTNVSLTTNSVAYAAEPVWNTQHKLIGVLYIQTPLPSINGRAITTFVVLFVGSSIILLAIVTPMMQERVEELHGTFCLHSEPCQGTRLHVCLPREVQL